MTEEKQPAAGRRVVLFGKLAQKVDQDELEAAIELGDAVSKELGLCCAEKGRVMAAIYRRLREGKVIESGKGSVPTTEHLAEGGSEGATDRAGQEA